MQHPFSVLEPEYNALLARAIYTRRTVSVAEAGDLIRDKFRWVDINKATNVPINWSLASFYREADSNYSLSPAQGDPWRKVSENVPRGRGPFPTFGAAAIDAYMLDRLNLVGAANWTWARALYEAELFNGFGYRARGIHSPYLWAGTDVYTRGKFTSDGHYDENEIDKQLGVVPLMVFMFAVDPLLGYVDDIPHAIEMPSDHPIKPPIPAPLGLGGSEDEVKRLQDALNQIERAELRVDGIFGRATKRAVIDFQEAHHLEPDGLVGPLTGAAIEQELAAA